MIRLNQGLGVPDGDVKFSPNKVASAQQCADKGGTLYDNNSFCCVEVDPSTGAKTPGSGSYVCAPTAFGPATAQQASVTFSPTQIRQTVSNNPLTTVGVLAALGILAVVLVSKRKMS